MSCNFGAVGPCIALPHGLLLLSDGYFESMPQSLTSDGVKLVVHFWVHTILFVDPITGDRF